MLLDLVCTLHSHFKGGYCCVATVWRPLLHNNGTPALTYYAVPLRYGVLSTIRRTIDLYAVPALQFSHA